MMIRPYRESDADALEFMAKESKFPYPDLSSPLIETIRVVEMDEKIVAAVAARRLVELFGWFDSQATPSQKMCALKMLHGDVATELRKRGYTFCEAGIPPEIEESFGKRLKRFGWKLGWPSYGINF